MLEMIEKDLAIIREHDPEAAKIGDTLAHGLTDKEEEQRKIVLFVALAFGLVGGLFGAAGVTSLGIGGAALQLSTGLLAGTGSQRDILKKLESRFNALGGRIAALEDADANLRRLATVLESARYENRVEKQDAFANFLVNSIVLDVESARKDLVLKILQDLEPIDLQCLGALVKHDISLLRMETNNRRRLRAEFERFMTLDRKEQEALTKSEGEYYRGYYYNWHYSGHPSAMLPLGDARPELQAPSMRFEPDGYAGEFTARFAKLDIEVGYEEGRDVNVLPNPLGPPYPENLLTFAIQVGIKDQELLSLSLNRLHRNQMTTSAGLDTGGRTVLTRLGAELAAMALRDALPG